MSPWLARFQGETGAPHALQVVMDLPFEGVDCFKAGRPAVASALGFLSNSIGLVLPAGIAKATQLASGTRVQIDVTDGALVIPKAPGQPQLEDLCSGITA